MIDYTGKKIGNVQILSSVNKYKYLCKCDCGNSFIRHRQLLNKAKENYDCGCHYEKNKKLIGETFGYLKVLSINPYIKGKNKTAICQCICGTIKEYRIFYLENNSNKSCGCKHWKIGKEHHRWSGDENPGYKIPKHFIKNLHGRRGKEVNVTYEFLNNLYKKQNYRCAISNVEIYFASKGFNFLETTASLDRIDSKKGYIEGNVQWVHKDVNWMKQDYSDEEYILWCKKISQYQNSRLNFVVTGCHGYIGSNLIKNLFKIYPTCHIYGIDNLSTGKYENLNIFNKDPRFSFIFFDISDVEILNFHFWFNKIDCIFHLASIADVIPSIENPSSYFEASVIGTHNILEAMRINEIKNIVYSASSSCYGDCKNLPTSENQQVKVSEMLTPYALFKWEAEREIEGYCNWYNINCISLRYFNVIGGQNMKSSGYYSIVVGIFLAQHFHNHPISRIGTGENGRDFINVNNVCELNIWAANNLLEKKNKNKYEYYNIGTGKITTINELIKLINNGENILDLPIRSNESQYTQADISKLKREYKRTTGQELDLISVKDGINDLMINNAEYFRKVEFPKYV